MYEIIFLFIVFVLFTYLFSDSQRTTAQVEKWRAVIHRHDENNIVFNFEQDQKNKKTFLYVLNAGERLRVDSVIFTVSDTLRTEKTLPQVTRIKVFPSSIIVDKKGKVIKLDTGFFGPGRGVHYENFKKEFYKTVDTLLEEK